MTDREGQVSGHSVYSIGPGDPVVFLFCSLTVVVSAGGTNTSGGGDLLLSECHESYLGKMCVTSTC